MSESRRSYYVETFDSDLDKFTPQAGVRTGPYSKWGLRKALRKLQDHGYQTSPRRAAFMVLVYSKKKDTP